MCLLRADTPDKLHTVGIPWVGAGLYDRRATESSACGGDWRTGGALHHHDVGYQNQPDKTEEASWYDDNGERWQRMGDIGRVDELRRSSAPKT